MTLRMIEGFELGAIKTELEDKYAYYDGSTNDAETGRLAGRSQDFIQLLTNSLTEQNEWFIGFGIRMNTLPSTKKYVDIYRGAARQCSLVFERKGAAPYYMTIDFYRDRDSSALAVGTTQLAAATWYYIELYVKVDPSAGAYELRINEIQEYQASGINTALSGTAGADIFHWTGAGGIWSQLTDDIYILDSTGTAPLNDFLGDSHIIGITISGNGNSIEWTASSGANYTCIDDAWNAYSTADYVHSNIDNELDLYTFNDIAAIDVPGDIRAVQLTAFCALETAGSRKFKFAHMNEGATGVNIIEDEKTISGAGANAAKGETTILEIDPETGIAWTLSGLNSSQFGFKIIPT